MPAGQAPRDPLLIAQVVLAAALPWLTARWLAPDQVAWIAAVTLGVGAFAVLHRRMRWVWTLPASALLILLTARVPDQPEAISVLTAFGAVLAGGIVIRARSTHPAATGRPSVPWAVAGWALVAAGGIIAVAGLLSARSSDAAFTAGQELAAEAWDAPLVVVPSADAAAGSPVDATEGPPLLAPDESSVPGIDPSIASAPRPPSVPPLAQLAFRRPGTDQAPVTEGVLYVGTDVTETALAAGPGHYPSTSRPGRAGNFAVAGHRTGWGSPFFELDELKAGDEVLVTDRNERTFTYVVSESVLVDPDESWVLGQDPLGTGRPTLTLTTCDPPNINDRRLIVFGTLADEG